MAEWFALLARLVCLWPVISFLWVCLSVFILGAARFGMSGLVVLLE